jgi:cyclic pyranopterin phosphate synthase
MPPDGVARTSHEDILSFEEIARFVLLLKTGFELTKVHITGGEPLVRRNITRLVAMLAELELSDLALTTNGHALANMADDLKHAGLRRANVSLDSLDPSVYAAITRGGNLTQALSGIEQALQTGLKLKINTVVLRNRNAAEVVDLARFALDRGCQIRFIELMPIGCAAELSEDEFVPAAEIREALAHHFSLSPVIGGAQDSHRDFAAEDRDGRRGIIGFISPRSEPFCAACTRLRLTSTGDLISCLAHGDGTNIRHLLRLRSSESDRTLRETVAEALAGKRERESFRTQRMMACVGG